MSTENWGEVTDRVIARSEQRGPAVQPETPLDPLLTLPQVCKLTTFSRASVYRLVSDGKFPAPLKMSGGPDPKRGRIAWRASDLHAWLAQLPRTV